MGKRLEFLAMIGRFRPEGKKKILSLWAIMQQAVEHNAGAIALLFVLNAFTIVWHHFYLYRGQELAVLCLDMFFLFMAVTFYVICLRLFTGRVWQERLLCLSMVLLVLMGALECFSIYSYQALIGAGIITAILQTNLQEAGEFWQKYVGWGSIISALSFAVLCGLFWHIMKRRRWSHPSRHLRSRILPVGLLLGMGAGLVLWLNYQSFVVNADLDVSLVRVSRSLEVALENLQSYEEMRAKAATSPEITENNSTVPYICFILGESTNRNRLHLYGYPLENTPNLDALAAAGELAVYRDAIAPQGATAAVLRELFTFADAEHTDTWYTYNNLIDILKEAGYRTYWLSNQESSGIWGSVSEFYAEHSHVSRYTQLRESREESGRLDEELFPLLEGALSEPAGKNFYVLHLMGTHSLYYLRFPYIFTKFTAADVPPPQNALEENKRTEIAQYANAVFYNDFVVSSIIGMFRDREALVIYLPDHGEELYDHGFRSGHVEENPTGEMLEVPLVFWGSPSFRSRHREKWQAICANASRPYMTDDMIHTILDILDIRTPEFDPSKSIINPAFDTQRPRIVQGRDYDKNF